MQFIAINQWAISLWDLIGDPATFDLSRSGTALQAVTNWGVGLAGTVALIYFIWGGIQYLTSAGNSGQIDKAKQTMTWSLIGLVVVISAYALVRYIGEQFLTNPPF